MVMLGALLALTGMVETSTIETVFTNVFGAKAEKLLPRGKRALQESTLWPCLCGLLGLVAWALPAAWRTPLLVALRVTLTLLLEGLVFLLFGYRTRRSWLAFAAVNLLTQGGLNALITGPGSSAYFVFGYGFGELVVMAVETAAFACLLREHGRGKARPCGNGCSPWASPRSAAAPARRWVVMAKSSGPPIPNSSMSPISGPWTRSCAGSWNWAISPPSVPPVIGRGVQATVLCPCANRVRFKTVAIPTRS